MSKTIQPRRRATTRRQPQSFEAMVRAAAAKPTLIPDVTELLTATEEASMIEAYIDQYCADDKKQELHALAKGR